MRHQLRARNKSIENSIHYLRFEEVQLIGVGKDVTGILSGTLNFELELFLDEETKFCNANPGQYCLYIFSDAYGAGVQEILNDSGMVYTLESYSQDIIRFGDQDNWRSNRLTLVDC